MDDKKNKLIKEFTEQIEYHSKEKNSLKLAENYYKRGNVYLQSVSLGGLGYETKKFYLDNALKDHLEALQCYKKKNIAHKTAESNYTIGKIYEEQKKTLLGLEKYKQANNLELEERGKILNKIVQMLENLGSHDEALKYAFELYDYNYRHKKSYYYASTFGIIGKIFYNKGEKDKALDFYLKTYNINEHNRDWINSAKTCYKIARIYEDKKDDAKALKFYIRQNEIYEEFKIHIKAARSCFKISKILFKKHDQKAIMYFENCIQNNEKALEIYIKQQEWKYISKQYKNIETVYDQLIPYKNLIIDRIIKFYEKIIEELRKYERWGQIGALYRRIGIKHYEHGRIISAINNFEDSIKYYKLDQDYNQIGITYRRFGELYSTQNDFDNALKSYENAIKFQLRAGNWEETERTRRDLGDLYSKFEYIIEALDIYDQSMLYFKNNDNWEEVAVINKSIGLLYLNQENYEDSIKFYTKAGEFYEQKNDYVNRNLCYRKIGECYSIKGEPLIAIEYYEKISYDDDELFNESWQNGYKHIRIGDVYLHQGEYDKAIRQYNNIFKYGFRAESFDGFAVANRRIGSIFALLNNVDEAIKHFTQALDYYKSVGNKDSIFKIQAQIASTYNDAGRWQKNIEVNDKIVNYLRNLRPFDATKFEIHSLRSQARILENSGEIKKGSQIYRRISLLNTKIGQLTYSAFHDFVHKIYEAELLSQNGKHDRCLRKLKLVKNGIEHLLHYVFEEEPRNKLQYLIEFRTKQVKLLIAREKAFIFETRGDFDESMKFFKECVEIAKIIIEPSHEQDYLLYKGIAAYYNAHYERVRAQSFFNIPQPDINLILHSYTNDILPSFRDAKKIFKALVWQKLLVR